MFDIVGDKIELSANSLAIPPFKYLYESIADKAQACKYIEYIIWLYKYNSPYVTNYPPNIRESKVKEHLFGDKEFEIPDEVLRVAEIYNKEFQNSMGLRYLQSLRHGMEISMAWLNNLSMDDVNDKIYKNIQSSTKEASGVLDSLRKVEEAVKLEVNNVGEIRGGGKLGQYEMVN